MGKNLKGKELGKGIYQRKDGSYYAHYMDKLGKRHNKYFHTVPEAKTPRFCMHALRHTYATIAIEAGLQPKLGHSSIKTARNRYVHVTTDSLAQAIW